MRLAEHPYQWNSYRFHQGVCFPGTIDEMEREDRRLAITSACAELKIIQETYPHPCTGGAGCPVTGEALSELKSVVRQLEQASAKFVDAEGPSATIPSTE